MKRIINGDRVEHRKTGRIGRICTMKFDNKKGTYGFSRYQVVWEDGTTTWVKPKEVRLYHE